MVSRSTLINFCATLLCTGSVAAAGSSGNRSSYLRQARESDSHNNSPSSSDNDTPRSNELAEFASSIAAYSAAYGQAITDDGAESQQPAATKINSFRDSKKSKNVVVINEDFCSTTDNFFTTHNNYIQHHYHCSSTSTIHGRNGVIQLSPNSSSNHRSTVTTPNLHLPPTFSALTITFSYQTTTMTSGEKFCMDLSTNNGRSWGDEECYEFGIDFENGFWYDDVGVKFDLEDLLKEDEDSLSVRWIVDGGSGGDVLLDWVKVVASP